MLINPKLPLILIGFLAGLHSANAAASNNYGYDALGRLISVSNAENVPTEAYRYDGVGNIVEKTIDGQTYRLSYDIAHQLKFADGPEGLREFTYDKAGRLVTEVLDGQPVVKYTYGYLDKVIAVERNGEVTRFDYDAQGMLAGKQLPDGSYEHWIWDGMALVARGDERYINESHITGGLPIVSQTSEGVLYHQHDFLGTTVASYSQDGDLVATYETTVFGKGELETSRSARFTGKPFDADLGAFVFPFRNYDPDSARWMSADPSGFPDGPNNHYYAAVPTMGVDPLGLFSEIYTQNITFTGGGRFSVVYDWPNFGVSNQVTRISQMFNGSEPSISIEAFGEYNLGLSGEDFPRPGTITVENAGNFGGNDSPEGDDWEIVETDINYNYFNVVPVSESGTQWEYTVRVSFDYDRIWER